MNQIRQFQSFSYGSKPPKLVPLLWIGQFAEQLYPRKHFMSQSNAHKNFSGGPLKQFYRNQCIKPRFPHFHLISSLLPSGMVTVKWHASPFQTKTQKCRNFFSCSIQFIPMNLYWSCFCWLQLVAVVAGETLKRDTNHGVSFFPFLPYKKLTAVNHGFPIIALIIRLKKSLPNIPFTLFHFQFWFN